MFIGYKYMIEKKLYTGRSGGSNPCVCEKFRTRPDQPWGPPSLPYNGYRVFLAVKRPVRGVDSTLPFSAEVKEKDVGLHSLF
jgi:hypothetical protein